NADPDGDGIENQVEYALGLNPNAASREGLPALGVETVEGVQYLTLTFRVPAGIDDVTYAVETAGELDDWQANAVQIGSGSDTDNTPTATYRDSQPLDSSDRRFMRLSVGQ